LVFNPYTPGCAVKVRVLVALKEGKRGVYMTFGWAGIDEVGAFSH